MSHAAALTDQAIHLLAGPHQAKRIASMIAGSYRTVQDWRAHRRRMCLDHAIELAAQNDTFRAALLDRIEQARGHNASALRAAAVEIGKAGPAGCGPHDGAGLDRRELGTPAAGTADRTGAVPSSVGDAEGLS